MVEVWTAEDELWPDVEVSTTRPTMRTRDGRERPLSGWDGPYSVPAELVDEYSEARDRFMAARGRLLDAIEGQEG